MTEHNVTLNAKQEEFAQALFNAYATKKPLKMSDQDGVVNDDDTAYAVQDRFVELKKLPTGGYKVLLTSKQTQNMFDSDSPLYGQQVDSHFLPSPALLSLKDKTMDPLLEVELGFRVREDLKASDRLDDLLHKTTVCGTVELPDSRFADWFPDLSKYNVMSDCAVGGFVVYGDEHPTDDDAANVSVTLYHDSKEELSGKSSEVLGNPLKSLQWLVGKLEAQGKQFKAGQLVSSGTFLLPPHLTAGKWEAKFDHGFGNVSVNVQDQDIFIGIDQDWKGVFIMTRKVAVVGMGHVGATVAHYLVAGGFTDNLALYDTNEAKVNADALDLKDAMANLPFHTNLPVNDNSQLRDCDVVVSALGKSKLVDTPDHDRFAEFKFTRTQVPWWQKNLWTMAFTGNLLMSPTHVMSLLPCIKN